MLTLYLDNGKRILSNEEFHADSILNIRSDITPTFTPSERSRTRSKQQKRFARAYKQLKHLQYRDKDRIPDPNDYKFLVSLFSFKTRTLTKLENSIKEKSVITAHAAGSQGSSSSHTTPLVDTDSDELRLKLRREAIDNYNPLPPPSVYIRPEFIRYIPKCPLFIGSKMTPKSLINITNLDQKRS
ncbi:hypothetical protein RhiirA4_544141 [Rhizophagus irregularis]|uniref:Uncharacterized protein n=1 Tax=Rhizophagus irregularis TaxID=588596 RepID=A0A2I1GM46_9GLOM|nr:hypothetical protein RhiirA4_544141 [Rhizophagus irregularis]